MKRISATDSDAPAVFWQVIESGGLVVYPTDTLYGLGSDAMDQSAAEHLAVVKGRGGPFSVMVGSFDQLREYALVSADITDKLLGMLPGPYTIILSTRFPDAFSSPVIGPRNRIGFRIPNHPFTSAAFQQKLQPVISTSVNRSGEPPLQDPNEISSQFDKQIDLLVDAGPLPASNGSTVIDVNIEPWRILRQGDGRL
jgi:L-threonylcarbamoyladenylate synthase